MSISSSHHLDKWLSVIIIIVVVVVVVIIITIIIIISAVHGSAGRWPPQLTPCTSILSYSHPLTATNFLDVVSPSPFGFPSYWFSFSGCPFWCYLGPPCVAHYGYMSCPLSSYALHSLYYIFHPCFRSHHHILNLVSLVYQGRVFGAIKQILFSNLYWITNSKPPLQFSNIRNIVLQTLIDISWLINNDINMLLSFVW